MVPTAGVPGRDRTTPIMSETIKETIEQSSDNTDVPEGFSRSPEDYRSTEHFLTLLRGSGRCWRLETEVDGRCWRLVVDVRPDELNRVLTALVPGIHRAGDHDPEKRLEGGSR